MSSANLLPPSAPPAVDPLYPVLAAPSENFRLQKINEISNIWTMRSATIASLQKNTNGQENSLIGVLPAPVFSRQRFPAQVLAPLCLWLACRQQFL